jgi:hypothetical protein
MTRQWGREARFCYVRSTRLPGVAGDEARAASNEREEPPVMYTNSRDQTVSSSSVTTAHIFTY